MRKTETREQDNKTCSPGRLWMSPMHAKILSTRHHYSEVEWRRQQLAADDPTSLPRGLHHPPAGTKSTSFDMGGIVSKASPPPWPSLLPTSYNGLPAIMAVLRYCSTHQAWAKAASYWHCQVLAPGMLVRQ
eukprot:11227169-Lingulodinium_polyedra.AAC.1